MKSYIPILFLVCVGCAHTPQQGTNSRAAKAGGQSHGNRVVLTESSQLSQIRTAVVQTTAVPVDEVVAPGKVQTDPNRISRVSLPVAGRIVSVDVRMGDYVRAGQPLLRLESPDAEGAASDCFKAEAGESQAKAALNKARADLDRTRDLYDHGAAPKKDVLNAEAEVARTQADLQEALAAKQQSRRKMTILGLKPCEFGQKVVVRAPISGKVLEISAVPGEYRNDTSAPLMTIADLSTVWVASGVPESSIRLIQPGERVTIELSAYPGEVFQGRVRRVADTVDPVTRSVEVLTELRNPDGRLRPEMYARIHHSHSSRIVPAVPASAVIRATGQAWVFVAKSPNEFERKTVQTGDDMGPNVPVLEGLQPGERIVVDGAMLLEGAIGGVQ